MKKPLKDRLVDYLRLKGVYLPSGELQRLTMEKAHQTPRTAVRRLQEAVNEGLLEVRYVKGAAQYRALPQRNYEKEMEEYAMSIGL